MQELINMAKDTVLHKRNPTPGVVPEPGQLTIGELAINTGDSRVYTKLDNGEVKLVGGSSTASRSTTTYTGENLEPNSSQNGSVDLGKSYVVLSVSANFPVRIRVYASQAYRTADVDRPANLAPMGDHGLLLELVTTSTDLDWTLSPMVFGGSMEEPYVGTPITITNLSDTPQMPSITFNHMIFES